MPFEQRDARLSEFDVVVCATSAPEVIISKAITQTAMQRRPARPLFFRNEHVREAGWSISFEPKQLSSVFRSKAPRA